MEVLKPPADDLMVILNAARHLKPPEQPGLCLITNEAAIRANWDGDIENDTHIDNVDDFIAIAREGNAVVMGVKIILSAGLHE